MGHIVPDYTRVVNRGFSELIAECEARAAEADEILGFRHPVMARLGDGAPADSNLPEDFPRTVSSRG